MQRLLNQAQRIPAWGWLLLISTALRLPGLGAENLWYDEAFTQWVSRLDYGSMMNAIAGDVHPPGFYLIEFLFVRVFGYSEFALRLPSAVFGILGVLVLWRVAKALGFDPRTAFTAGIIHSVLPAALYYSQEARMYSLLTLLVLVAVWSLVRRNWIVFALTAIGIVYTQNLGLFYVFALGIVALVINRKQIWFPMMALGAVMIAWSPWSLIMFQQSSDVSDGFWLQDLTPAGVVFPLAATTMFERIPEAFQLHVYGAAFGATMIALIACRKWLFRREGLYLIAAIFGAPAVAAAVSLLWGRSIYLPRALLPSGVMVSLLWGYMLNHMSAPNRRIARWIVAPMLAIGLVSFYLPENDRPDLREFLQVVNQSFQPGDVVYHTALHTAVLYNYYLGDLPYRIRPHASDLNQSLTEQTKAAMQFSNATFEDVARAGYHRVWLVVYTNPMSHRDEMEAVDAITTKYPHLLVNSKHYDFADQFVYLVFLPTGVASK
jgi:4-amino-4-deoxy-L-arabinose transferase-like glycosyltransferase